MDQDNVSGLLDKVRAGDGSAFESLISIVYDELRRMAASLMHGQVNGRTLQPTALVNEAFLRLVHGENKWDNKAHFFGAAARAMRQVLIAEARRRSAQKRAGNAKRITFRDLEIGVQEPEPDVLALEEAMTALAGVDERFTRIMELRYFAGCSLEEIAEITGCSLSTVKRDWTYARAWLFDRMTG
jgi:RNA polymerase sigma factor (TIGR02999 family)